MALKVNLGSGNKYQKGWVNVDRWAAPADVVDDITTVRFAPESCERVRAYHVIEHLTREDGVALVYRVFDWLRPGGLFEVESPDRDKCLQLIAWGKEHRDGNGITRCTGGAALLGGTGLGVAEQREWHGWIRSNRSQITRVVREKHCFPDNLIDLDFVRKPGEPHRYVWTAEELSIVFQNAGYQWSVENPLSHGKRHKRDFRIVGRKPDASQ